MNPLVSPIVLDLAISLGYKAPFTGLYDLDGGKVECHELVDWLTENRRIICWTINTAFYGRQALYKYRAGGRWIYGRSAIMEGPGTVGKCLNLAMYEAMKGYMYAQGNPEIASSTRDLLDSFNLLESHIAEVAELL